MSAALDSLRIAGDALRANWFRAVLTALGVVIGVGSLVAVSAVSAGAQAGVAESIRLLGANVVIVDGEIISIGTKQSPTDRVITAADVADIDKLPVITAVAPHQDIEGLVVSSGRNKASTYLVGMTPAYADIHNRGVSEGRPISEADISYGRSIALIGPTLQKRLFAGGTSLGRSLRVGNHEFEIVGVLDRRGKLGSNNLDDQVFIPLPIVTRELLGGTNTKSVDVQVRTSAEVTVAQDAIGTLLRKQHKLPPSYPDNFSTEDQLSILKTAQSASSVFRALTFALGGIALLVGGIGIMNMMLVSVHERTREIGIRKSVGADPGTVQLQFLIEALVLSMLGGLAGLAVGIGATKLITSLAGWQTLLDPTQVALSFLVSLAVGVFFGYYPARRAARLDPIVALHVE